MKNVKIITDDSFKKLVKMTKLNLSETEKVTIHSQLDEALNAIKVFDELDLTDIPPLAHPGDLNNVMREDIITASFTQSEALQNAKATHEGYVMVQGVLEDQT